jgi:hypothetical protein
MVDPDDFIPDARDVLHATLWSILCGGLGLAITFVLGLLLYGMAHAETVSVSPAGGGGSGGVSSIATACPTTVAAQGAVTLTGTMLPSGIAGTTYTPSNTNNYDCGLVLTFSSNVAIQLPQAGVGGFTQNGWFVRYNCQLGCQITATTTTFTPGGGTTLNVPPGGTVLLETDDTFYYVQMENPYGLGGGLTAINFNAANSDNQIPIYKPTSNYRIVDLTIANASAIMSTATWGLFSAAAGGGTAIFAAGQTNTITASAANTANNSQTYTPSAVTSYNFATLFFRVGTAQGTAATADVMIRTEPLP